ncbi:hypothetical protein [Flavobacterium pectinovorum]|uniref:TolB amino-terminal domain-containing protein n=1 Tax=Flavobacterium pectinovorum TaxID=29533 RepID=A0A502EBS0_9FLAO|nr:hypothetical protein [Flavobacterium pectinovorum]TPG33946.1 hypothetical protein EAH81_23655 [Flavobacterium pectinovorum]
MEKIKNFSSEEICLQLEYILNFKSFKNSPTLTNFLSYIVHETINEREEFLKEYSIAVNVLKRSSNFNSNDDAAVRIHAGRLRRTLNDYYLSDGTQDSIIISIPKGGYIPEFKIPQKLLVLPSFVPYSSTDSFNPTVAIFPFQCTPKRKDADLFAALLRNELTAELSRFEDITVIGYYSPDVITKINDNILQAGKLSGADYIITGSIQYSEQKMRVRIILLITATGEIMMTKSIEKEIVSDIFDIQDEIIKSVITSIGGYYGLIFQEMEKAAPEKVSKNISIWKGIYNYYKYQRSYSIENYKIALISLRHAVVQHPQHAVSWAMLGEVYLNGAGLDIKDIDNPIEEGYRCCMEALKIDPSCQHGFYTLTLAHVFKKEKEECLIAARQCIQLNPNCSVIVSGVAVMLICAGYFEEGFTILEKTIKLNPHYPWWINCGFSFYYLHKKDYATAYYWANKIDSQETFWDPLLKSSSLALMNQNSSAETQLLKLLELEPETPINIKIMLSTLLLSDDLVEQIILGLNKAGLMEIQKILVK